MRGGMDIDTQCDRGLLFGQPGIRVIICLFMWMGIAMETNDIPLSHFNEEDPVNYYTILVWCIFMVCMINGIITHFKL